MAKLIINDFSQGITDILMNTNTNQCEKCENLLIEKDRSIKTRFGCELYYSTYCTPAGAKRIDGMFYYPLNSLPYFQAENKIYKYNGNNVPCGTTLDSELVTDGTLDPVLVETFLPAAVNTGTEYITLTQPIANGTPVEFTNSGGGLPNPLAADTTYYVVGASGNTIQVSLTYGGGAVNLTTQGTGTHSIYRCIDGWTIDDDAWSYQPASNNIRKDNTNAATLSRTIALTANKYYLLSFKLTGTIVGDSIKVGISSHSDTYIRNFSDSAKQYIYPTTYGTVNTYYYVLQPNTTATQTLSFWRSSLGGAANYTTLDTVSVKEIIDDSLNHVLSSDVPVYIDTDIMRNQQIIVSSQQKRGIRFILDDRDDTVRATSLGLPKPESAPSKYHQSVDQVRIYID
jgi:hypothetical protein